MTKCNMGYLLPGPYWISGLNFKLLSSRLAKWQMPSLGNKKHDNLKNNQAMAQYNAPSSLWKSLAQLFNSLWDSPDIPFPNEVKPSVGVEIWPHPQKAKIIMSTKIVILYLRQLRSDAMGYLIKIDIPWDWTCQWYLWSILLSRRYGMHAHGGISVLDSCQSVCLFGNREKCTWVRKSKAVLQSTEWWCLPQKTLHFVLPRCEKVSCFIQLY